MHIHMGMCIKIPHSREGEGGMRKGRGKSKSLWAQEGREQEREASSKKQPVKMHACMHVHMGMRM